MQQNTVKLGYSLDHQILARLHDFCRQRNLVNQNAIHPIKQRNLPIFVESYKSAFEPFGVCQENSDLNRLVNVSLDKLQKNLKL